MSKPYPPQIAICHSTARPDGWQESWTAWQQKRSTPGLDYEYVLCMDAKNAERLPRFPHEYHRTAVNYGRESCNVAHNVAAAKTSAPLIVIGADDVFPCKDWDLKLLLAVERARKTLDDDFVIWVSTGNPNDRNLILVPILSRARYLKYGYTVWDEYPTVCADNDFFESAMRDGVVIDARDSIRFEHRHFTMTGEKPDEIYKRQNALENYKIGEEILARRRREGFPSLHPGNPRGISVAAKPSIAVCMPGESHKWQWSANNLLTMAYLMQHFDVLPVWGYSSNPHMTRAFMWKQLSQAKPDYILWIDHDNIVAPADIARLLDSLEKHPDASGVTGWCWFEAENDELRISCGRFDRRGVRRLMSHQELMAGSEDLKQIGWTGFPCFLMRGSTLMKIGRRPFLPILSEQYPWGFAPEDIAFSMVARKRGLKFLVDRRVEVPHHKDLPLGVQRRAEHEKTNVA